MTPHDEANLAQIAWLREALPAQGDQERVVFELPDGSHLTLHFTTWTWEPAGHFLVPHLEPLIHDCGYLPLEVRVRDAAAQAGVSVSVFAHTLEDHGPGVVY
ncbi:hypothetical protein [Deinococcus soli (ex Cha et al. 2016)]|uniref:hypothetical protein n=1 Tax=Deinococcus soli (ex Cha et al. 2016) TaxID=1309411 RepID=UPI001663A51F|nr:hypothetical protein [Deinococcus soli (ex Cha et al. 2016)]GGB68633.1 hypothetical protein GCM10008019_26040 [Deinococcus soli (ex Cha et al. 2016)]